LVTKKPLEIALRQAQGDFSLDIRSGTCSFTDPWAKRCQLIS
jgi:hypothetical protein